MQKNNLSFSAFPSVGTIDSCSVTTGLAKLEHACIALKVPKSGNAELDALILEARRMDLAGRLMQGAYADPSLIAVNHEKLVENADALLRVAGWVG